VYLRTRYQYDTLLLGGSNAICPLTVDYAYYSGDSDYVADTCFPEDQSALVALWAGFNNPSSWNTSANLCLAPEVECSLPVGKVISM